MIKKCVFMVCLLVVMIIAEFSAGHAEEPIELIVRGDDMGLSHDINMGFIKAYKEGILTSASIMVPALYFDEAVELCKANPGLAVGLHITLISNYCLRPILDREEIPSLVAPNGFFYQSSRDLREAKPDMKNIEKEVRAQIEKACASGLHFVYLDAHMGMISFPGVKELLRKVCEEQNLLLSGYTGETRLDIGLLDWTKSFHPKLPEARRQNFYNILTNLKPGLWLAVFHPGLRVPPQAFEDISARGEVTDMLCAQETKRVIGKKGIKLISYKDMWDEKFGKK